MSRDEWFCTPPLTEDDRLEYDQRMADQEPPEPTDGCPWCDGSRAEMLAIENRGQRVWLRRIRDAVGEMAPANHRDLVTLNKIANMLENALEGRKP